MTRQAKVVDIAMARAARRIGGDFDDFVKRCDEAAAALKVWTLDADHQPVPATLNDLAAFRQDFEANCRVAETFIGEVRVSTVFLGLDHGWGFTPKPLLFETMAFEADGQSGDCWRTSTWDEALESHAEMVKQITARCLDDGR